MESTSVLTSECSLLICGFWFGKECSSHYRGNEYSDLFSNDRSSRNICAYSQRKQPKAWELHSGDVQRAAAKDTVSKSCAATIDATTNFRTKTLDFIVVRVISAAGDVETVGADIIAKLSAETSLGRPVAAWDQRIVMPRTLNLETLAYNFRLGKQDLRICLECGRVVAPQVNWIYRIS